MRSCSRPRPGYWRSDCMAWRKRATAGRRKSAAEILLFEHQLWLRDAKPCGDPFAGHGRANGEDCAAGKPPFVALAVARIHHQLLSGDLLQSIEIARQHYSGTGETRARYVEGAAHRLNGTIV